ncbi:MAG: hypothetical protein LBJ73_02280 [Rickettsiales bacterium]|nr:hypothetical protein [Rickettsiales bacterium]
MEYKIDEIIANVIEIYVANNFIEMITADSILLERILKERAVYKDLTKGIDWVMVRYQPLEKYPVQKSVLENFLSEFAKVRKR